MSFIHKTYSNTRGFNPIATKNTPRLVMGIVLVFVALIHLFIKFYLFKKIDIKKVEPTLVMTIEMQQQTPTTSPTITTPVPTLPKAPEKPKPVKPPVIEKKTTPPISRLKEPEATTIASSLPTPKPEIVPVINAPMPTTTPPPETSAPTVPTNNNIATPANSAVSSGVMPLFRVPPEYPASATRRHIEGWVKIEFTVNTDGTVDNAVVISAEPEDIFNEAALTAIKQWKFKEKIVDGVSVTQRAVQKLQFKLEH